MDVVPPRFWKANFDQIVLNAQVPNGAAGYYLLGRICVLSNRHESAIQYFAAALTLDPLLWCAYEELCNLGEQNAGGLMLTFLCTP